MNWKKLAASGLASIALSLGASNGARANLVQNGSFETNGGNGQIGYNTTASGWYMANSGGGNNYTFLYNAGAGTSGTTADTTGANGIDGNVQLWGPGSGSNNGLTLSPNGGAFIAQDPVYQTSAIDQNISGLTVGQQYQVSFDWAGAQQSNHTGPTTEDWQVSLGSQSFTTATVSIPSEGFSGWMTQTFTFTATSTTETLSFLAGGGPSVGDPPFALLDGVTMNAVPEPSALALLALGGLGAVGVHRRRRRARA